MTRDTVATLTVWAVAVAFCTGFWFGILWLATS